MQFLYHMPTKIIFGRNCINSNSAEFLNYGRKPLIITGNSSAKKCGALADIIQALCEHSMSYELYDGVKPNPTVANVMEALDVIHEHKCDFVIAIGGGSPIDAGKAVSLFATQNYIDHDNLFTTLYTEQPLPFIAIPTTAGTGSEVTQYSILTDVKNETKKNLSHVNLFPKIAFLDPRYTENLPYEITINTAIDAFSHAIESHLSKRATEMSKLVSGEAMRIIVPCLLNLSQNTPVPKDIRGKLLYASMLGGIAIAQTGTTIVHAMGYSLTYFKNLDHGMANGVLLCKYLEYVYANDPTQISQILALLNMNKLKDLESIIEQHVKHNFDITDEEICLYSQKAIYTKAAANTTPSPSFDDIKNIYCSSLSL